MFWGAWVTLIVQEFLESIGKQKIPSTGSCFKTPQGAARWSLGRLNHRSRGAEALTAVVQDKVQIGVGEAEASTPLSQRLHKSIIELSKCRWYRYEVEIDSS